MLAAMHWSPTPLYLMRSTLIGSEQTLTKYSLNEQIHLVNCKIKLWIIYRLDFLWAFGLSI